MERLSYIIKNIEEMKTLNIKVINIIDYNKIISELNNLKIKNELTQQDCDNIINLWNIFRRNEMSSANKEIFLNILSKY